MVWHWQACRARWRGVDWETSEYKSERGRGQAERRLWRSTACISGVGGVCRAARAAGARWPDSPVPTAKAGPQARARARLPPAPPPLARSALPGSDQPPATTACPTTARPWMHRYRCNNVSRGCERGRPCCVQTGEGGCAYAGQTQTRAHAGRRGSQGSNDPLVATTRCLGLGAAKPAQWKQKRAAVLLSADLSLFFPSFFLV